MTGTGAVIAAVVSFLVTSASGIWLIPYLKRLKFGQNINTIGPVWHKAKQGTPTMGGLMFICGIVVAFFVILLFPEKQTNMGTEHIRIAGGLIMALVFGFIGFLDDYIKVVKKRNLGLTPGQKMLLQLLAGSIYLAYVYLTGGQGTTMIVPFLGVEWQLGIFYWPLALFIIVGTVNSVNLTDGIDGLAASVTTVTAVALLLSSKLVGSLGFASFSAALAGGCLGFLVWNAHPAKVFMGDTGSLFLGGMICAIAFGIGQPLLLVPFGMIYIFEAMSDIIQVTSFKTTGKRVFKMAPIHHHFEMSGWSENKIVIVFTCTAAAFSALGVLWLLFYMGM